MQIQFITALELKTRQLQHKNVGIDIEQIKRRRTEVATGYRTQTCCIQHGLHQGGHRALAVRTGDAQHRAGAERHKQIDIAAHRDTLLPGVFEHSKIHPQAR